MAQIFISYRREDSAGHAGRLEEALERRFGAGRVFRDVADLPPGRHFPSALRERLHGADAVLVLIGPRWLEAARDGVPRLSMPDDYVRMEIDHALRLGIPVVPVLIDETPMPVAEQLPAELRGLAAHHAVRLSDAGWADDAARLIEALEQAIGPPPRARRRLLAALAAAIVLGGGAAWFLAGRGPAFPAGQWVAEVRYDWGDRYRERFVFERIGDTVTGSASFLGVARPLEEARWGDGQLSFVTRSESSMGEVHRTTTHRYLVVPAAGTLTVHYSAVGGFSRVVPQRFAASPDR